MVSKSFKLKYIRRVFLLEFLLQIPIIIDNCKLEICFEAGRQK